MSDFISIARRQSENSPSAPIGFDEWTNLVASDAELNLDELNPNSACWSGVTTVVDPTFEWTDGEIWSQNPDTAQLQKAFELARRLNARVYGDDGDELFDDLEAFETVPRYDYDLALVLRGPRCVARLQNPHRDYPHLRLVGDLGSV